MKTFYLNSNSWHFKLVNKVWNVETHNVPNMCPYFWLVVFTLVFSPVLATLFLIYFLAVKLIRLYESTQKTRHKTANTISHSMTEFKNKKLVRIVTTSGEKLFMYGLFFIVVSILIIGLFSLGVRHNWWTPFAIVGGALLFIGCLMAFDEYWDDVRDWFVNTLLFKIIAAIFKTIFNIIVFPFKFIGKKLELLYKDACPPIVWGTDNGPKEDVTL